MRRARRGSRTKQHREAVRGGSQGPKRKVNRGCGRNREVLGEFFLVRSAPALDLCLRHPADRASSRIAAMHPPRPPSIDQGVIALIWAIGLGLYIYFGLLAIGESAATAVVISMVSFAAIWLFVRLRGEDIPRRRGQPQALCSSTPRAGSGGAAPGRRRACARARCRAVRRAARAPGRPADRGSPSARRAGVRRGQSSPGPRRSSRSVYRGTCPSSVIPRAGIRGRVHSFEANELTAAANRLCVRSAGRRLAVSRVGRSVAARRVLASQSSGARP